MSMSTAASVTALNNQGVHLIECGDYRAAISVFTRGVSIVREELARQYKERSSTTDVEAETHLRGKDCFTPSCPFHKLSSESSPLTNSEKDETMIADNQQFIFTNPIFIPPTEDTMNRDCYNHYVKLSFIQLYNLALANHLFALHAGQVYERRRLEKALVLYEIVYTLQHTENDIQPTALQVMAIVNNLGQIHTALQDLDKARECFENLLSTLMYYVADCEEHDHENDHANREQLDGLLGNVLPLIFAKGSKPASAA